MLDIHHASSEAENVSSLLWTGWHSVRGPLGLPAEFYPLGKGIDIIDGDQIAKLTVIQCFLRPVQAVETIRLCQMSSPLPRQPGSPHSLGKTSRRDRIQLYMDIGLS